MAKALALASLPEKVRAEALSLPQLAAFSNALSRNMLDGAGLPARRDKRKTVRR